jgi:hypothetical protein
MISKKSVGNLIGTAYLSLSKESDIRFPYALYQNALKRGLKKKGTIYKNEFNYF